MPQISSKSCLALLLALSNLTMSFDEALGSNPAISLRSVISAARSSAAFS
jgi:hypothetical protein